MRKYGHRTTIELDEITRENLEKQCKKLKKTKAKFLRDLINKRASHKKLAGIHAAIGINEYTISNLSGLGNNINQIAHRLHEDKLSFNEMVFYEKTDLLLDTLADLKLEIKTTNKMLKGVI